jgi:integrase
MTNNHSSTSLSYLTLEQVRQLVASISDSRDNLMIRLLYETGCTPGELTNIRVGDIGGNIVKINNNKLRHASISGRLAKDISVFVKGNKLSKESFLISTRQSSRMSEKRVSQIIQSYTERFSSSRLKPIMFRYYHITHAYISGVFIEDISKQLGITKFRIFQVLQLFNIKPRHGLYNNFLRRV